MNLSFLQRPQTCKQPVSTYMGASHQIHPHPNAALQKLPWNANNWVSRPLSAFRRTSSSGTWCSSIASEPRTKRSPFWATIIDIFMKFQWLFEKFWRPRHDRAGICWADFSYHKSKPFGSLYSMRNEDEYDSKVSVVTNLGPVLQLFLSPVLRLRGLRRSHGVSKRNASSASSSTRLPNGGYFILYGQCWSNNLVTQRTTV